MAGLRGALYAVILLALFGCGPKEAEVIRNLNQSKLELSVGGQAGSEGEELLGFSEESREGVVRAQEFLNAYIAFNPDKAREYFPDDQFRDRRMKERFHGMTYLERVEAGQRLEKHYADGKFQAHIFEIGSDKPEIGDQYFRNYLQEGDVVLVMSSPENRSYSCATFRESPKEGNWVIVSTRGIE